MIRTAKANEVVDALKLAFGDLDQATLTNRLTQSLIEYERNPNLFDGLLVDVHEGTVRGVIWCVRMPGNTSVTGLPRHVEGRQSQGVSALMEAANRWLETERLSLNQFVLEPTEAAAWQPFLAAHDHPISIELNDMVLELAADDAAGIPECHSSERQPPKTLNSRPVEPSDLSSLQLMIELTFHESLDCPELAGHQLPDETLNGYRSTGDTDIEFWRMLELNDKFVGCVLLGMRPNLGQAEVVYIGVQPDSRRLGVGSHALRLATELAKQQDCRELVAAVDRRNFPAVRMYESVGFQAMLSRFAIVRLLDNRSDAK